MSKKWFQIIVASTFMAWVFPASAQEEGEEKTSADLGLAEQIFTVARMPRLCVDGKVVDRKRLAEVAVNITNATVDSNLAEDYILNSSDAGEIKISLGTFFKYGMNKNFKFCKMNGAECDKSIEKRPSKLVRDYFVLKNNDKYEYEIFCQKKEEVKGGVKVDANLRIRKAVKDLQDPRKELKATNAAQFSYKDDLRAEKKVISVEGVIGYLFSGDDLDKSYAPYVADSSNSTTSYGIIPYIFLKSIDQIPNSAKSQDVFLVEPGVVLNSTWVSASTDFAFDFQLSGSVALDTEQNLQEYKGSLRVEPAFRISPTHYLFVDTIGLGLVDVRPEVALLARADFIDEAEGYVALEGKTSYSNVGIEGSLLFFGSGSWLQNFKGQITYVNMKDFNGIFDIQKFSAGLTYSPPELRTVTFEIEYVDGFDIDTFKDEEKITSGIGVRF